MEIEKVEQRAGNIKEVKQREKEEKEKDERDMNAEREAGRFLKRQNRQSSKLIQKESKWGTGRVRGVKAVC